MRGTSLHASVRTGSHARRSRILAKLGELGLGLGEFGIVLKRLPEFRDRFRSVTGAQEFNSAPIMPQSALWILFGRLVNVS
jgi:hypothetical protein